MAVSVDVDKLPEKGQAANPETKYIKAGNCLARLVSYVELGKHFQVFGGKNAVYESGKLKGTEKPPVLHIALTFEFPAAPYTGDYPLTIRTSSQFKPGEFMNSLTVPAGLAAGTMTKAGAMKTKYVKYLTALQQATGENYLSIMEFAQAQVGLLINITNRQGKGDNKDKIYANMKPEGIQKPEFVHPVSGEVEVFPVPEVIGEYCPVFDWDAPTADAWKALKPWDQKVIKDAVDFMGSPTEALLANNPELEAAADEAVEDNKAESTPTEPHRMPKQEDIPV